MLTPSSVTPLGEKVLTEQEKSRFVRINGQFPTDTCKEALRALNLEKVLFIGSGAVENSWKPIRDLCTDIVAGRCSGLSTYGQHSKYFYNEPYDHFLASLAFQETAYRSHMVGEVENPNLLKSDLWILYSNAIQVREALAAKFCAETSLSLRALDYGKYGIDLDKTLVVTSNWDDSVWTNTAFKHVIYLHGHCAIKNSIVLPTQFITDECALRAYLALRLLNRDAQVNLQIAKPNIDELVKHLKALPGPYYPKTRDLQSELSYAHALFLELITSESLRSIFFWGYGFNLYDAEVNLLLTLASHARNPPREIEILNPDPKVLILASQVLARELKDISYHHPYK
jgi:hypothetical protein